MAKKTTSVLLKGLLDMCEVHTSKVLRRSSGSPRQLASCGAVVARKASLSLGPSPHASSTPSRSFINLVAPINSRRMEYSECRNLGYSPEQLYNVVANVDKYQHFVPWCKKSRFIQRKNGDLQAELVIGFPPIVERYTSDLTFVPNHKVRALCTDGSLFSHLETVWRFSPVTEDCPSSCKVQFYVSFEFKSLLHSQLAGLFFEEVVKQMVGAFESRAATLYGKQQVAVNRRQRL